jgi:hypothetical protein
MEPPPDFKRNETVTWPRRTLTTRVAELEINNLGGNASFSVCAYLSDHSWSYIAKVFLLLVFSFDAWIFGPHEIMRNAHGFPLWFCPPALLSIAKLVHFYYRPVT